MSGRWRAAPPAYSQASPYAPRVYAAAPGGTRVIVPAPGSCCEEAAGEAQDAAAKAQATCRAREAGRADRTVQFAARHCR